jgi:hypothetical protein
MGMTTYIIAIIINKVIFTLSFNIFCNSNKILIKSFSNSLLISNFFHLQLLELVFHFFFISSRFFIYNSPYGFHFIMGI